MKIKSIDSTPKGGVRYVQIDCEMSIQERDALCRCFETGRDVAIVAESHYRALLERPEVDEEAVVRKAFEDFYESQDSTANWYKESLRASGEAFLRERYPKALTHEERYAALLDALNEADSVEEADKLIEAYVREGSE